MKTTLLIILSIISLQTIAQNRYQLGAYVPIDFPDKSVMPKMSVNGGFGIAAAYSPIYGSPFFIELKGSWGGYASRILEQTYQYDNGSQTRTDVTYTSSMNKYLLGVKYMIGQDFRAVRGFITPQIGVAKFKSRIVIADPQDVDDCQPLDRETAQRFTGFVYGGEVGAEVSLDRIFTKMASENQHKIVLSANFLGGFNHFKYVNVRYMEDAVEGTHVGHDGNSINASFINVSTNEIHEHQVAELYHSALRMWGFNVGYTFNF